MLEALLEAPLLSTQTPSRAGTPIVHPPPLSATVPLLRHLVTTSAAVGWLSEASVSAATRAQATIDPSPRVLTGGEVRGTAHIALDQVTTGAL